MEQLKKYAESEGIKCEISSDYIRNLRQHSLSKNKKGFRATSSSR